MSTVVSKIIYLLFAFVLFLFTSLAIADLYQWQDEKGDMHVVDDILLVPPQYKDKVKVIKPRPADRVPIYQEQKSQPLPKEEDTEELYGGHSLGWWTEQFKKVRDDIRNLEKTISEQKDFTLSFEKGRSTIQKIYSKEDVEKYETYKKEIPKNEERLLRLKADLEELLRKATAVGVPKKVRGE